MATFRSPPHNRWPFVMEGGEPVIDHDWFDFFRKISSLFTRGQTTSVSIAGTDIAFQHGVAVAVEGGVYKRPVIYDTTGSYYLTPEDSGSLCVFAREAGGWFFLPTPEAGLEYEFFVLHNFALNPFVVQAKASPERFLGSIIAGSDTAANGGLSFADTSFMMTMEGDTTSARMGTNFRVTAINDEVWLVRGLGVNVGAPVSPIY